MTAVRPPRLVDLLERTYTESPAQPVSGAGRGIDPGSTDNDDEHAFAFAFDPPDRWRLESPPGRLRALGDNGREVVSDPDRGPRRAGVGDGWRGQPACWLLRPRLTGVVLAEWGEVDVVEPAAPDLFLGRPSWRVVHQRNHVRTRLLFDQELPILLGISGGDLHVRLDHLTVGSVNEPITHALLTREIQPALEHLSEEALSLLGSLRKAVPEVDALELCDWRGPGGYTVRMTLRRDDTKAELTVDRRRRNDPPYERLRASMVRSGDAGWSVSVDHDSRIDAEYARRLGLRITTFEG